MLSVRTIDFENGAGGWGGPTSAEVPRALPAVGLQQVSLAPPSPHGRMPKNWREMP